MTTLRSRIIPCLLLRDGGLVKTFNFKNEKYVGDPINAVKIFNEKEVDELILLDIGATVGGHEPNYALLSRIASASRMPLCYGGGIRSAGQAARIIALGFEKISISSSALERPELIGELAHELGSQSVVVTVDVKKNTFRPGHTVYTHNGTRKNSTDLLTFCRQSIALGAGELCINSIDRDGSRKGYDIPLARAVRAEVSSPLTIAGGAGDVSHMKELIQAIGTAGVAAGSLFVFKGGFNAVLLSYARPDLPQ